ncbi:hypothetical protein LZ24_02464 [Desulfobotulus alkaliphilus]|uniref:Uncharacterized protein n=1 Tax=Desulfobotulus alkaliphilus TaxID=622671 RepID=A0A562RHT6_9BACT|nr:hypothetical protein [Desulfobotulus alkaliphilus]TWI68628.1 hypothetical protein LZ24_02464 [Desulfobotulus alkaliphilus]
MGNRAAFMNLKKTLNIMKNYTKHIPPVPKEGRFYRTYDGSIVYIFEVNHDMGRASAVILQNGSDIIECGDKYDLTLDGYHDADDVTGECVLGLQELLDIRLPAGDVAIPE